MFRRQHGSSRFKNARSVGINTKRFSRPKLSQTPIKTFHIEPISNSSKRENAKVLQSINQKLKKCEKASMTETRMAEVLTLIDLDEVIDASWERFKRLMGRRPLAASPIQHQDSLIEEKKLHTNKTHNNSCQTEKKSSMNRMSATESDISCQATQTISDKYGQGDRCQKVSLGCNTSFRTKKDAAVQSKIVSKNIALGDKQAFQQLTLHTMVNSIFGWDVQQSSSNLMTWADSEMTCDASVSTLGLVKTQEFATNTMPNSIQSKDVNLQMPSEIKKEQVEAPRKNISMSGKERFEAGLHILRECNKAIRQEWFQLVCNSEDKGSVIADYLKSLENHSKELLCHIVNVKDKTGNSAIHYAVSLGHWDCVNVLISSSFCDLDVLNRAGYSPAMLASLSPTPLTHDGRDTLRRMLNKISDIDKSSGKTGHQTALMIAVLRGRRDVVELLVAQGADINIKDESGNTALTLAHSKGNQEIIQLLEENFDEFDDTENEDNVADKNGMCLRLGNITISHQVSNIRKSSPISTSTLALPSQPVFL